VGGPITGKGAHLMIIDDPIKNAEDAMSEVMRRKQWDWWLSTARTRMEPGGVVIVLMTRWHDDDLGGRLMKAAKDGGDPVREIRLPALAGADDPLGRKPGEALWPERYAAGYLENTRTALGAYWFSAMYQGTPTPDEGGVFNRQYFRYFELRGGQVILDTLTGPVEYPASACQKISYVDLAESTKKTADYTVLTEVWVTPGRDLLVMNVTRDRIPGSEQPQFFIDHYVGRLKIEAIGYQSALAKGLIRKGYPVEPVYPDKDKVTRAAAAGVLYRGGKVFHRRGAEWLTEFEAEMLAFPAGEHDDQVDTIAYAARDLPTITTETRVEKPKKGRTMTGGVLTQDM
jgi:phage terminase large subunit-like protein